MVKTQNFYVRSSLFVILSIFGGAVTYAVYPVLARILKLEQLGDYIAIVGISNQLLGILLAFSVISVGLVKQYGEQEASEKIGVIQKVLLWLFIGLSAIVLVLSPFLQHLLNIQNISYFFILSIIMLLAVPSNIWIGFLQGHKEQIRVGLFTSGTAVLKFILILLLAKLFGVNGGLWGLFVGSLLGLFIVYYLPGRRVPGLFNNLTLLNKSEKNFLRHSGIYIAQSVFVVTSLVFLQNYDLNRAKALFTPQVAGIYGGISIISNAFYFVLFLLVWVLLPEFSLQNPKNNRRVLRTAYLLIASLASLVIIFGLLLANLLLPLVLGDNFAGQGQVLIIASLYQISLVSLALYGFYLLVLRKMRSLVLSGLVLASCLVIPLRFTNSPLAMISSLLVSVAVGISLYVVLMGGWRLYKRPA